MAKTLLPSQCDLLHLVYGPHDCCLCQANKRILELEAEVQQLKQQLKEEARNEQD